MNNTTDSITSPENSTNTITSPKNSTNTITSPKNNTNTITSKQYRHLKRQTHLNKQQTLESDFSHFDLQNYLKEKRNILDESLKKIIHQLDRHQELVQAMEHSLMAGGKRLRPTLAMASAEAVGGDSYLALPAACAIEMIHTYSLIHDDLPAMDDDDLRRGVPTCHKAFSEATAILAGDALLTHAFTLLTNPWVIFDCCPDKAILFELVAIISRAAGLHGMVEGQMMDMLAGDLDKKLTGALDKKLTGALDKKLIGALDKKLAGDVDKRNDQLTYLKKLHELKTGRMIMVSVEAGAVSAGGNAEQLALLSKYSRKIGLAFQVTDDILNVEGDPVVMGKAAGSDELNDKMTFPALLGLESSKAFARQLVQEALDPLSAFQEKALPLKAVARYILERNR